MSNRRQPVLIPPCAALMEERGLRVADVCAVTGLGGRVVRNLRSGDYRNATVQTLVLVASVLHCKPSELVPGLDCVPAQPGARNQEGNALAQRVLARRAREQVMNGVHKPLAKTELAKRCERVAREQAAEREALTAP